MSIPDVLLTMLHAAGVDPDTLPFTWNVCVNPDGTVSGHMHYDPRAADSHKVRLARSAGKPQLRKPAAGKPQSLLKAPSSTDRYQPSTGKPQRNSFYSHSAGTPQQPHISANSSQPSSKRHCPSRRRRNAQRRAAWRLTLSDRSTPAVDSIGQPDTDCNSDSAAVVSQQSADTPAADAIPQLSGLITSSPASGLLDQISAELVPTGEKPHMPAPIAPAKRERVPTYEVSDTFPGVYLRSFNEPDSDEDIDLPLSDPRHSGHLAHQWYQEFLAKQALD